MRLLGVRCCERKISWMTSVCGRPVWSTAGTEQPAEARRSGRRRSLHGILSARAGADQVQANDGARDGCTVRRSKCHEGTQSSGRSVKSSKCAVGPGSSRLLVNGAETNPTAAINCAAGTFTDAVDVEERFCSASAQLSSSQGRESTQHPEPSVAAEAISRIPAASSIQCFVTGSHTASRSKATKRRSLFTSYQGVSNRTECQGVWLEAPSVGSREGVMRSAEGENEN